VDHRAPVIHAHRREVDRVLAHKFDTARDDDVVRAGDHALGCEVGGLLARAALPVNSCAWDRLGESGGKHCVSRDVDRLLTDLAQASADNVVDRTRVEAVALGDRAKHRAEKVDRVKGVELPTGLTSADGGADGVNENCTVHDFSLPLLTGR
jgi:hypothetical protein